MSARVAEDRAAARAVSDGIHPVGLVFRKELADFRLDRRWRVMVAVVLVLISAALMLGVQQGHRIVQEHAHASEGDQAVWLAQGHKNPHAAAHFGQYAFKPPGPLAMADPGVDAYAGSAIWLEAHKQNEAQFRSARDGTLTARMGHLTLANVLQVALPLMALLIGYASISGERESGTWRQVAAMGVSAGHWMLGKALAAMLVMASLLLVACAGLGFGVALWSGLSGHALESGGLSWGRLLGMLLAYALYLAGFVTLAMAASTHFRRPRTALVVLLTFWALNGFIAPRWMSDWARQSWPLPTTNALKATIAEEKRTLFGHDESHPAYAAFLQRTLAAYGVRRKEDLPVSLRGLALRENDEVGYRLMDKHQGRLQQLIAHQDALRARAGWLFPLLAVQPLSMSMAGTDNRHHHDFASQAERHRRQLQTLVSQDLIDHAGNPGTDYEADPALWARMPGFSYRAPELWWALSGHGLDVLRLACWALGSLLLMLWTARRLPPL